jgi:hypothetical protein
MLGSSVVDHRIESHEGHIFYHHLHVYCKLVDCFKSKRGDIHRHTHRQHGDRNKPFSFFLSFFKKGIDTKNRLTANCFRIIVGSLHSRMANDKDLNAVCCVCKATDGPPCRVSNWDSREMCSICLSQQTKKEKKASGFLPDVESEYKQSLNHSPVQKKNELFHLDGGPTNADLWRHLPYCARLLEGRSWTNLQGLRKDRLEFDSHHELWDIISTSMTTGRQSVKSLATGWTIGVQIPAGILFSYHCVQTGSGVHPASYPMGAGDISPGVG